MTRVFLAQGRAVLSAFCAALLIGTQAQAQPDPLPSWNDTGPKQAIVA